MLIQDRRWARKKVEIKNTNENTEEPLYCTFCSQTAMFWQLSRAVYKTGTGTMGPGH